MVVVFPTPLTPTTMITWGLWPLGTVWYRCCHNRYRRTSSQQERPDGWVDQDKECHAESSTRLASWSAACTWRLHRPERFWTSQAIRCRHKGKRPTPLTPTTMITWGLWPLGTVKSSSVESLLFSARRSVISSLDKGLERTKQGVFSKLTRAIAGKSKIDDEILDNLEEVRRSVISSQSRPLSSDRLTYLSLATRFSMRSIILRVVSTPTSEVMNTSSRLSSFPLWLFISKFAY